MPRRATSADPGTTPEGVLRAQGLASVLGYQLAQASVVLNRVFVREVGAPQGLRSVEYTVLQLVDENPGCSPVQLARALSVTKPNITMWVDRLVERGLVQRSPNLLDKRAQELRATEAGSGLARQATARLQSAEGAALPGLSPGERAILVELLQKLARGAPR